MKIKVELEINLGALEAAGADFTVSSKASYLRHALNDAYASARRLINDEALKETEYEAMVGKYRYKVAKVEERATLCDFCGDTAVLKGNAVNLCEDCKK